MASLLDRHMGRPHYKKAGETLPVLYDKVKKKQLGKNPCCKMIML